MLSAALLGLAAAAIAQGGDPLTPGLQGQLQCAQPDRANRTCKALSSFSSLANGRYRITSIIALSDRPALTFTMTADGEIVDGAACGMLRREHYMTARVEAAGRVVPREQAAVLMGQLADLSADSIGRTVCTTARPDGDGFLQSATIDGVAQPELNLRYIWVGADDGFVVRAGQSFDDAAQESRN